ncbi:MAG: transposase [Planctomycetaceae bacterium]
MLQSVPGVGAISTQTLLAELPELGRLGRGQIAPLAGVAPMNRDSGPFRGHRTIGGGRAAVRSVRSMAALAAQKFNPVIRRFADRLAAQGTPPQVSLTACMRKLLVILTTLLKTNTPWNPQLLKETPLTTNTAALPPRGATSAEPRGRPLDSSIGPDAWQAAGGLSIVSPGWRSFRPTAGLGGGTGISGPGREKGSDTKP